MQLCIRQRVFSWTDTYDVYDASGTPRYFVKAEFFTLGHQIHVYDKQTGREVGSIHQRLFTFLPTFDIIIDGTPQGKIRRKFTMFTHEYDVDYHGWQVYGNFFGWDYRVSQGSAAVLEVRKEIFHWADTYVLEYANPAYEIPGLLLVLAIDAANCTD